jgi:hypothetical protein
LEERKLPAFLVLPITAPPIFKATVVIPAQAGGTYFQNISFAGGNFLGTVVNTTSKTPLSLSYGLNPISPLVVGITYYGATVTNNGVVYGNNVPHAGQIAWLVTNRGPAATTPTEQSALQAAIWTVEFAPNFQLDADNDPTLISAYLADLNALGNNTAPVGDAIWISPDSAVTLASFQLEGVVAVPTASINTRTAVSASASSAAFGQPVTFGALVTNTNSKGPIPTGAVQFQVNGVNVGNPVPLSASGTANYTETNVGAGSYSVGAVYEPTDDFQISASANNPTLTITPAVTEIVISSTANPAPNGTPIGLLATVESEAGSTAIPLGTVVFGIHGRPRPAVNLFNGNAVRKGLRLPPGKHTITVFYTPANGNFQASEATFVQFVTGADPAVKARIHRRPSK